MSTHKTTADQGVVLSFLKENFSTDISNFEVIIGGEGSQAYSFTSKDQEYVIRINKHHTLGFKKDEYAYTHFASPTIPIPKVYTVGKITSDLRFCISEKVKGDILTSFSHTEVESLQPNIFAVLDSIHATDIKHTKGFGKWNAEGNGEFDSWKQYVLTVDKYAKGMSGVPGLFETTFLEKDFWDVAYARLTELLPLCPEERFLVHGDYGFNNMLSDGKDITGVIDWESSMYADFLYDVAWLSFWSKSVDYQTLYLEHLQKKGKTIEHFNERILCYKLFIGLSSLSFYAYSSQKEKYEKTKSTIGNLLNK
ncbi:MAG: hypothetical protein RL094_358 [Candidatus Parcubacteria bacterium]|jgi:hygromycin-B 4-O-kinase